MGEEIHIFWILQISDEIFTPFVVFFVLVFLVFKFQVLVKVFLKDFAYLLGERIPRNTFKWLLLSLYFFLSLWNILFHWFLPFQPKFRLPPLTRKKKSSGYAPVIEQVLFTFFKRFCTLWESYMKRLWEGFKFQKKFLKGRDVHSPLRFISCI